MTENDTCSEPRLFAAPEIGKRRSGREDNRWGVYGTERRCRVCSEWMHETLFTRAGSYSDGRPRRRYVCCAAANGCEQALAKARGNATVARRAHVAMLERRRAVFDGIDGVPRWRLYLLVFPDGELYVGLTDDPVRREAEHRRGSHNDGVTALALAGKRWRMEVIGAYPSQADGLAAEDAWMDRLRAEDRTVLNERRNTKREASL